MGANMTQRLLNGGHRVVVSDLSVEAVQSAESHGAIGAASINELVDKLSAPRTVWVMVPAGKPTDGVLVTGDLLEPGDIVIDGGNSNYKILSSAVIHWPIKASIWLMSAQAAAYGVG